MQELLEVFDRALNYLGREQEKTRLPSDEQWDDVSKLEELEETTSNGIPQSASGDVGHNVPHIISTITHMA